MYVCVCVFPPPCFDGFIGRVLLLGFLFFVTVGYSMDNNGKLLVTVGYCTDNNGKLLVTVGYCMDNNSKLLVTVGYSTDNNYLSHQGNTASLSIFL